jgi:hypothetical protein
MNNNNSINDRIMDLMDKYNWMPASIARYVIEKRIDIDKYL